jgi:hypothetical protein
LYATRPGQEDPKQPRVAKVFKGEDEMDDCIRGLEKRKELKMKLMKQFLLPLTKLRLIIMILASGIVGRQEIYLVHWLESRYRTVWKSEFVLCVIAILHGLMLSIRMTKMGCASLQPFSRSSNSASSYAKPTFLL